MSELYGRVVEVLVGPKGGTGKLITDLRIQFKVEKTLDPQPNQAQIQITNLSDATRALCETEGAFIVLRAGYTGAVKTLYQGDIARVDTRIQGPDIVTSIEAGDGEQEYRNAKADVSFGPGAKFTQVFGALSDRLGLAKGSVKIPNPGDQFLQGYTGAGTVREQLDYLAEKQGLEWSIQDGQLQMLAPEASTDEDVVVLSAATGLVGSPFKTKVTRPDLARKGKGKDESGIQAIALLNAELRPGRRIQVESRLVNGIYKIQKVSHSGDTHGNSFYSELEAR